MCVLVIYPPALFSGNEPTSGPRHTHTNTHWIFPEKQEAPLRETKPTVNVTNE